MQALVRLSIAIMLLVSSAAISGAASKVELNWPKLVPKPAQPLVDPLGKLTQDQRFDFETVVWSRSLTVEQRQLPENKMALEDAETYEKNFKKAGIDITKLMVQYADWERKILARQKDVVKGLDGKQVRIPGYLLPLEFSEKGVHDFLLVPYVGACVHVPPPPPNQIILLRLKKPFRPTELYTPVWASGLMRTKATSRSLFLVDGSRDISIGYHIDKGAIEVYKGE